MQVPTKLLMFASAVVVAGAGCSVWRDYGDEIPFEPSSVDTSNPPTSDVDARTSDARPGDASSDGAKADGDSGPCTGEVSRAETVDLENGTAELQITVCRGDTRWYALSTEVGSRLETDVRYPVDDAVLSATLYGEGPSSSAQIPVERPTWRSDGVGFRHRITASGTHYVRIQFPEDSPGDAGRLRAELSFTTSSYAERVRWIAPDGEKEGDGSASNPWRSWTTALAALEPGDLLVAAPGTWTTESTCAEREQPCLPGTSMPRIDCDKSKFDDGTPGAPIVVAAERERRSVLVADGGGRALFVDHCSHWRFDGLRARNRDTDANSGGEVVYVDDAANLRLDDLLVRRPNREQNVAAFRIEDSESIRVAGTAIYSFHEEGIVLTDSEDVEVRRAYIHSRSLDDTRTSAGWTDDDDRGDEGIGLDKVDHVRILDTVIEDVAIAVEMRAEGPSGRDDISVSDENLFRGLMIRSVDTGLLFDSEANHCSSPDAADCSLENNRIRDSVVLDSGKAFRIDGGIGNSIAFSTAHNASEQAFSLGPGDSNENDESPPSKELTVSRSLAFGSGSTGFHVDPDVEEWSLELVNSFGPSTSFDLPDSPSQSSEKDPEFGGCRVYVPSDSPLYDVEGDRVGAEVIRRHEGEATTERLLWDQLGGEFPCGATITPINDDPATSCRGLHKRFHVGHGGCPTP